MTKGEQLASIIQKLRGKQNAYRIDQIAEAAKTGLDEIYFLHEAKVLIQKTVIDEDFGMQFYYALSPFYRQYLKDAPQTEAVKECYQILFPEGDKEAVQTELFSELNTISELKKEFLK